MSVEILQALAKIVNDMHRIEDPNLVDADQRRDWQESIRLTSLARDIIEEHGVSAETSFRNQWNHEVTVKFKQTPEVRFGEGDQEVSLKLIKELSEQGLGRNPWFDEDFSPYLMEASSPLLSKPRVLFYLRVYQYDDERRTIISASITKGRNSATLEDLQLVGQLLTTMQTQLKTPVTV